MKKLLPAAALLLLSFTLPIQQESFKPLYQLAGGTWVMKTPKGTICEQWTKKGDNELSGRSFRVAGKDTTVEENVQLILKDGMIWYIPTVNGENDGKPVPFKLISVYKNTYEFSNPNHDYPQTVGYQLVNNDSLNAWIDGTYKGIKKRVNFHYIRVN